MKIYKMLDLNQLLMEIKDKKMPIRTAYKFNKLAKKAGEEGEFYQEKFSEILKEYAKKDENDQMIYSEDGNSILIIEGKEEECNEKVRQLRDIDVECDSIKFKLEELEDLNLTFVQLDCLMDLIED